MYEKIILYSCTITTFSGFSYAGTSEVKVVEEVSEAMVKKDPYFCMRVAADVLDLLDPNNDMGAVEAHDVYQQAFDICMG